MNDQDAAGGCLAGLMLMATVASWLGSGMVAWNWTEPNSFWQVILFLFAWGLLGKIFDFVLTAIVMAIASMFG